MAIVNRKGIFTSSNPIYLQLFFEKNYYMFFYFRQSIGRTKFTKSYLFSLCFPEDFKDQNLPVINLSSARSLLHSSKYLILNSLSSFIQ